MLYLGVINREFIVSGNVFSPLLERYQYKCNNYWDLVKHIPINELGHHWKWGWLGTCSVSSYYLNPQWIIANWTTKNKYLLNTKHKKKSFIWQNACKNDSAKACHFVQFAKDWLMKKTLLKPYMKIYPHDPYWLFAKPEPIMIYCQLGPSEEAVESNYSNFHSGRWNSKCHMQTGSHSVLSAPRC